MKYRQYREQKYNNPPQNLSINNIFREIKDNACKNKNKMLLKQGQLENKKGFLEIQNTKSEIKFNRRTKR